MNRTMALIIAAFLIVPAFANASTISGTAFEWYTLEPLQNVIVDINTTPQQTDVAVDGLYLFNITEPGSYSITAQYFENNHLKYETSEIIQIKSDGNFKIDLILLPALGSDDFLFDDADDLNLAEIEPEPTTAHENNNLLIFMVIIAIAGIAFYIFITRKPISPSLHNENAGKETPQKPSAEKELEEVLAIIKNYGGRITQKELREKLSHSEAKVSLIVAELEHLGKIKKFKKGRGNIIVLK